MIRLRPSSASIALLARSKTKLVGLDLGDLSADEQMSDDDLLGNLERFYQVARRRNVDCYLWGVRRRRVLGGAIGVGYGMVNGLGLMSDIGEPAAVLPLPRETLASAG